MKLAFPRSFRLVLPTSLILLAISTVSATETPPSWRIGVILPLSGSAASVGEAAKNAMELAREDFSPQTRAALQFQYEDDMLSPTISISALNRMLSSKPLDAVINISSPTGGAIAPLTEGRKIPFISISSNPDISRGRRYTFNFWVTPEEEVRVFIPEALRRGLRRMARVGTLQEGVLSVTRVLDNEARGKVQFVLSEDYLSEERDFRTVIARIRAVEPPLDGVVLLLMPGQLATFAKQARSLGMTLPFAGMETFEDLNEVRAANGALEGAWYVNASDGDGDFLARYRKRFPGSSSYGAANAYDAALLLASAYERGVSRDRIHDFLANLKDFKGACGTYSATGDQRFSLPAVVKMVRGESFETLR